MKLEEFELLDESDKAWKISKSFFPNNGDPELRWIPKSLSKINDAKTVIYIEDWFYNAWLKEIEKIADRDKNLQIAIENQNVSRQLLRFTNSYQEASAFVKTKISDLSLNKGLSNTRIIFYLGEFAKHIESETEDSTILIFNHRLRDLLNSSEYYQEAYDFIKAKFVAVQSPTEEELTFLMAEFKEAKMA